MQIVFYIANNTIHFIERKLNSINSIYSTELQSPTKLFTSHSLMYTFLKFLITFLMVSSLWSSDEKKGIQYILWTITAGICGKYEKVEAKNYPRSWFIDFNYSPAHYFSSFCFQLPPSASLLIVCWFDCVFNYQVNRKRQETRERIKRRCRKTRKTWSFRCSTIIFLLLASPLN